MSEPEKLDLRQYIEEQFKEIKENLQDVRTRLDYILHPKNGIFAELQKINSKADAAHRRIDSMIDSKQRKRRNIDRLVVGIIGIVVGTIVTIIINKLVEGIF